MSSSPSTVLGTQRSFLRLVRLCASPQVHTGKEFCSVQATRQERCYCAAALTCTGSFYRTGAGGAQRGHLGGGLQPPRAVPGIRRRRWGRQGLAGARQPRGGGASRWLPGQQHVTPLLALTGQVILTTLNRVTAAETACTLSAGLRDRSMHHRHGLRAIQHTCLAHDRLEDLTSKP